MRAVLTALAVLFLNLSQVLAQQEADTVDPRYKQTIEKMAKTLDTLPSYRVDVTLAWRTGDGHEGMNGFVFLFDRSGKFRIEVKPDGKEQTSLVVANNGEAVTMFMPEKKIYTQGPALDPNQVLENTPLLAASLKGSLVDSLTKKA